MMADSKSERITLYYHLIRNTRLNTIYESIEKAQFYSVRLVYVPPDDGLINRNM
jgi:hypothetical protein